jgi:hypothetical protein
MGALADWTPGRIAEVSGELAADRYVFAIGPQDDMGKLAALSDDAMVVLGLIDPAGGDSADVILSRIDAAAEILDQDRLALTVRGGLAGQSAGTEARVLRQLADISVQFWGFAI